MLKWVVLLYVSIRHVIFINKTKPFLWTPSLNSNDKAQVNLSRSSALFDDIHNMRYCWFVISIFMVKNSRRNFCIVKQAASTGDIILTFHKWFTFVNIADVRDVVHCKLIWDTRASLGDIHNHKGIAHIKGNSHHRGNVLMLLWRQKIILITLIIMLSQPCLCISSRLMFDMLRVTSSYIVYPCFTSACYQTGW